MAAKQSEVILDSFKRRKIKFCEENGLQIPNFENLEDFLIEQPRPKGRWEIRLKCSNCGALYKLDEFSFFLDICPHCSADMETLVP